MQRNNNSIMIFEIIRGGGKLTGWGKNGPAHSFPGEKTDWGEIPACYTGFVYGYPAVYCESLYLYAHTCLRSPRGVWISAMPCKPGVAGSIPGFSIKPLSVSLRVLPSYNKHTNHKPSRRYWLLPRESHKIFFFFFFTCNVITVNTKKILILIGIEFRKHFSGT